MITKDALIKMYWQEEKHCRQIAEELGTTADAVDYQFRKLGIKKRSKSEARKLLYKQGFVSVTSMRGEKAINWRGGRQVVGGGYVRVILQPSDSFFQDMCVRSSTCNSYSVPEHRLVVAKHLNRCLSPIEQVHHLNGNKQDNRLENLQLISPSNHSLQTFFCHDCPLKKQNRLLLKEVNLLRQRDYLHK